MIMTTHPPTLATLEQLRRERVHQAQAELARRRADMARSSELLNELGSAERQQAQRFTRAFASAAAATDVAGMRSAAEHLRALRAAQRELLTQRLAAEGAHAIRVAAVQTAERALLDAELGRRVVGNMVARRVTDEARRRELAEEEAAADLARARRE
jgi:hypothetical protein